MDDDGTAAARGARTWSLRRRVLLIVPITIAAAGLGITALALRPAVMLRGDREALGYSVGASAGSGIYRSTDDCTRERAGHYRCAVAVPDGQGDSGTKLATYRVAMGRFGCWTATGTATLMSNPEDAVLHDCLGVRDFYRPMEAPERYD